MSNDILFELEELIDKSARKRESFLLAITKSSRAISNGANDWFESEVDLLKKEMEILVNIMPEDVQDWKERLNRISVRFKRAISFLNQVVDKAERGELTSIREAQPPPPNETTLPIIEIPPPEEEKKLDLVSAILEVFDAASELEKLIKEVEKESKRTVSTARLVIRIVGKRRK